MPHSFVHPIPIPAKPTFGVFKEPLRMGEYLFNKKADAIFCSNNICNMNKGVKNQGDYLLLKKIKYLKVAGCVKIHNSANLNTNLITKLNLNGIPVLQSVLPPYETPVNVIPSTTIYLDVEIDPTGALFGDTPCGLNNFLEYLEPNLPTIPM